MRLEVEAPSLLVTKKCDYTVEGNVESAHYVSLHPLHRNPFNFTLLKSFSARSLVLLSHDDDLACVRVNAGKGWIAEMQFAVSRRRDSVKGGRE